jgi:hypothetical protein
MEINYEQIKLMQHAIGLQNAKSIQRHKYNAYRNYFCENGNSKEWEDLVNKGLATSRSGDKPNEGYTYYFVTKLGLEALGKIMMIKITEQN